MEKTKWENQFKTCIGYVSLREVREEYFLTWEDWEKLSVANKGDVITVGDEDILCVGTVEELLAEINELKEKSDRMQKFFFRKAREAGAERERVKKLCGIIKPILGALELDGLDVVDVETGDILTK